MQQTLTLNSGSKIPVFGLGTWQASPGEVGQAVEAAITIGVRHFDCAAFYGNQAEVGDALKKMVEDGTVKREELFITSKLWNTKHRPCDVKPTLLQTLSDLKLSYLNLYLIHWPIAFKSGDTHMPVDEDGNALFDDVHFTETWKVMEECVREGLVKDIGLSNFNEKQIQEVIENGTIVPAVNQVEVHTFLDQRKLIGFCKKNNIAVTAYKPLASPDKGEADLNIFKCKEMMDIAETLNKTPAQVALRFLIQQGCVVIPKSVKPHRIKENAQVFDFELSEEDMSKLYKLSEKVNTRLTTVIRWNDSPYYPF